MLVFPDNIDFELFGSAPDIPIVQTFYREFSEALAAVNGSLTIDIDHCCNGQNDTGYACNGPGDAGYLGLSCADYFTPTGIGPSVIYTLHTYVHDLADLVRTVKNTSPQIGPRYGVGLEAGLSLPNLRMALANISAVVDASGCPAIHHLGVWWNPPLHDGPSKEFMAEIGSWLHGAAPYEMTGDGTSPRSDDGGGDTTRVPASSLKLDDQAATTPVPIVSPVTTLFSSKGRSHGAPDGVSNYGNTLSLLLIPPCVGDNNTILIAATRANVNTHSNVPVLRRSTDGGESFGAVLQPVGGPVPGVNWQQVTQAYDAVANILIVMLGNASAHSNLTCESGVLHQTVSTDRGLTFSRVQDISHSLPNLRDRRCISPSGGIGIQLRPGTNHAGRVLIAATHHAYQGDIILRQSSAESAESDSAVYNASDDLHRPGLDEMQLVQLSNGSIMALARNCADATGSMKNCMMASDDAEDTAANLGALDRNDGGGGKRVMLAISDSGGEHWSTPRPHKDLVTPVCNFGVTHYKNAVLFCGPYNETTRMNLSVLASIDGNGVSFDRALVLHAGAAGYSSIQCGLASVYDCAVLFSTQTSREIQLVRFQSQALLKTGNMSGRFLKADDDAIRNGGAPLNPEQNGRFTRSLTWVGQLLLLAYLWLHWYGLVVKPWLLIFIDDPTLDLTSALKGDGRLPSMVHVFAQPVVKSVMAGIGTVPLYICWIY